MNTEYFISLHWKFWFEDGILRGKIFSENFTLAIAQEGVSERIRISRNTAFPVLSDCRKVKHFDKETSAFLARSESTALVIAGAILVNNQLQKLLGNFFIHINKPAIPTRLFTDEAEALTWLKQFKEMRTSA